MVIGTYIGLGNAATIALAVVLAFMFGYAMTLVPLVRAGLTWAAAAGLALAADTASIAVMEIVDNAIMLAIPGAMDAGLSETLFWGSLAFSLVIAGAANYCALAFAQGRLTAEIVFQPIEQVAKSLRPGSAAVNVSHELGAIRQRGANSREREVGLPAGCRLAG